MPWIDKNECIGCGICVEKCPVGAVSMEGEKAKINMEECIHCGVCHSVCPEKAVRHDSEKIPDDVKANVEMTKRFMEACAKFLGEEQEKWKCLKRMKKHFSKEKVVAEKTLDELDKFNLSNKEKNSQEK
ncbi:MAG: 4Fe-4S binding protein [Candidatus Omnitrophota bacterium]|nr:4Fe-4S binding protein [Candidatus Omnitrophota bacterium]